MARAPTGPSAGGNVTEAIVAEAARIICEESVLDYRSAKLKAAERLGLNTRSSAMPDNARIQAAVIEYQRIFGGLEYATHLRRLRDTAVQAMRLLAPFEPRLVGAVATGAINSAHRVQLHGFADKPESLDLFLEDRGIPYVQDERDYRYPDGSEQPVPLSRFEAGDIGIDIAMFTIDDRRRAPLSPADGLPTKRLTLIQAEALAAQTVESILGLA